MITSSPLEPFVAPPSLLDAAPSLAILALGVLSLAIFMISFGSVIDDIYRREFP